MSVCKAEDAYTTELQTDRKQALWVAHLSNGETVYQDDHRPGLSEHSAWIRLADYLRRHNLSIDRVGLKFRSNEQADILPEKAVGYFFAKSAIGAWGTDEMLNFYVMGVLDKEGVLRVQQWQVPDLVLIEEQFRDPASAGQCLIRNQKTS